MAQDCKGAAAAGSPDWRLSASFETRWPGVGSARLAKFAWITWLMLVPCFPGGFEFLGSKYLLGTGEFGGPKEVVQLP